MNNKTVHAALVGLPNSGKTSLFNALTGKRLPCANYPGVTVELNVHMIRSSSISLTDLPGIYSIAAAVNEEKITAKHILDRVSDFYICILDATRQEASLSLAHELLSYKVPTVFAVTMTDVAKKRGDEIDFVKLEKLLGAAVIEVNSRSKKGVSRLINYIKNEKIRVAYAVPLSPEKIYAACVKRGARERGADFDRVICGKFSLPILACVLLAVFFLTFWLGDTVKAPLEAVFTLIYDGLRDILDNSSVNARLTGLICDGILNGVFSVLTFLPNMFILFLLTAVLEDFGYMARVAYICDGAAKKFGLSGRSVLPLVLGFGCSVPAVMATRCLDNERERRRCASMIPFCSCSAKLPVYMLLADIYFKKSAPLVLLSLYAVGFFAAMIYARLTKSDEDKCELIVELPEYRPPRALSVWRSVSARLGAFITRVGSVILLASVGIWFISNVGIHGFCDYGESFGANFGSIISPLFKPLGFGFPEAVCALIMGFAAKEAILSSLSVSALGAPVASMLKANGMSALGAYSFMLFVLFYMPCVGCEAVIARNFDKKKAFFDMIFRTLLAYAVSFVFFTFARVIATLI